MFWAKVSGNNIIHKPIKVITAFLTILPLVSYALPPGLPSGQDYDNRYGGTPPKNCPVIGKPEEFGLNIKSALPAISIKEGEKILESGCFGTRAFIFTDLNLFQFYLPKKTGETSSAHIKYVRTDLSSIGIKGFLALVPTEEGYYILTKDPGIVFISIDGSSIVRYILNGLGVSESKMIYYSGFLFIISDKGELFIFSPIQVAARKRILPFKLKKPFIYSSGDYFTITEQGSTNAKEIKIQVDGPNFEDVHLFFK